MVRNIKDRLEEMITISRAHYFLAFLIGFFGGIIFMYAVSLVGLLG